MYDESEGYVDEPAVKSDQKTVGTIQAASLANDAIVAADGGVYMTLRHASAKNASTCRSKPDARSNATPCLPVGTTQSRARGMPR